MSIIQPSSIQAIAHSVDIPKLSDEAAKTLAPDLEYRLREVVQEALKFAKHAKRTKLTTEDIHNALKLRNVEPVYGFSSKDPAKYLRVAGHPDLMCLQDPELSFNQLIESALPKLPRDAGVTAHWLAIKGVQPDLPENASMGQQPSKRRQLMQMPGQPGSRAAGLQDIATAAAAAAAAGLEPQGMQPGLTAAAATDPAAVAAAAAAGVPGQQQQQHMLAAGPGGVGVSPRSVANAALQLQLPLRHAVSRELQVYFDRVVGLILSTPAAAGGAGGGGDSGVGGIGSSIGTTHPGFAAPGVAGAAAAAGEKDKQAASSGVLLTGALSSVAADPGLHPLVPYFSAFIADGVKQHLGSLVVLHRLLLLTRALLANPELHLAPYLQQLLPAVVTCVVTKQLGVHPTEDHWAIRRQAAALLSTIAATFSAPHHNLQPRLCRVLLQALLEGDKPLPSKYGAVVGLQALGPQVVRTLLIPHLEPFMSSTLIPALSAAAEPDAAAAAGAGDAMDIDRPSHEQQQQRLLKQRQQQQQQLLQAQAWCVYDALVSAVGGAMYDLLVGHLRSQLPLHLLLPRSTAGNVTQAGEGDWQQQYTQTLLAARRQATHHHQQQQRQQQGTGVSGSANPALQQQQQQAPMQQGATAGRPALKGPPRALAVRAQHVRAAATGDNAAGGANSSSGSSSSQSIAEVLGQSWREGSDVQATLGALLELFGEDLLPCLPLPQLAAVSL